ncbi:MAG: cupredoxin domain-containing protein [Pseudonocardiales bacterium]|nr:cupredoxin domain-containing protein [Pseudonocardiales bacterium]MBV9032233.1 cupredoxin domain-containing protein [Pseudonocardiales bacterium]MBW0009072.1 cupredoxin domain-containing protein [Pseudonocardiales bacterium]
MSPPTTAVRGGPTATLLTVLVAVLGLVAGCGGTAGGGGGGPSAPTAADTVVIKNFTFVPASVSVAPGTRVMVLNEDQAPHTLTARDKSFDTGTIPSGQRREITAPTKPGDYPYICTLHPYMTGTLIVQ